MLHRISIILIALILLIPGCLESQSLNGEKMEDIPLRLSFKADTLDRPEDGGATFDLKDELENGPVLMLWIGSGCSGCHDWTELIRQGLDNGSLNDSTLSVISVHGWSQIEGPEEVMKTFGNDSNNSFYTPWKIVMGKNCLLYTSPSPRDLSTSRMPSSA